MNDNKIRAIESEKEVLSLMCKSPSKCYSLMRQPSLLMTLIRLTLLG